MRILYVLDFFYPQIGGVPTLFLNLTLEMVNRGHSVTVITTLARGTKSFENYKGIKILRFGKNREEFLLKASKYLLSNKDKFDIIHTSTYYAMIPSSITSFVKKIPAVVSIHEVWSLSEMTEFFKARGFIYFLEQMILFTLPFQYYISPSLHTKNDLIKIGIESSKIKVIPHGVSGFFNIKMKKYRKQIRKKYKLKDSDVVCLFVAKPTVFKGIEYLLEAIKEVNMKSKIKFLFVLSPLYNKEYKKLLRKISSDDVLKRSIILTDHIKIHEDMAKIIGSVDFVVVPSLTEGFGFVAAEAASIGVPSIVTKGTSLTEIVENNKNSIYVKMRDSKELSHAILRLATDENLIKKLSRNKKFKSWDEVSKEYEKVYEDIIEKFKSKRG